MGATLDWIINKWGFHGRLLFIFILLAVGIDYDFQRITMYFKGTNFGQKGLRCECDDCLHLFFYREATRGLLRVSQWM